MIPLRPPLMSILNNMAAIRKRHKLLTIILLIAYLILLFYFLFFSEAMGRTAGVEYRYNIIPFGEIRRFISLFQTRKWCLAAILNLAGNVVAFMPFGAFLAVIMHPKERWYIITLFSFELSLCVELIQLWTRLGCCDVDDLILNTAGGLLGYVVYKIWKKLFIKH